MIALYEQAPLCIAGFALVIVFVTYTWQVLNNPVSRVPGPWHSKWTSLASKYQFLLGKEAYYVHSLHQKYGPIVRIGPSEVDISDVQAVQTIYAIKSEYTKTEWYNRLTSLPVRNLFDATDFEYHRRHRRLLGANMTESSLKTFLPIIVPKVDLAILRMREEMKTRGVVDVWKWWLFMATDIIGELTFGESFQTLEQGRKSAYTEQLELVAPLSAMRSIFPNLATIVKALPIPIFRQAVEGTKKLRQYSMDSLSRHQRLVNSDPTRAKQSLFTKLYKAVDENELTFEELLAEAQGYIVAGSDTTANTLTYLVWSVARRPDIKATLLSELRQLPGDYRESDLRHLPYLSEVIEETLRMYSAVPGGLPRSVPVGGAELAGHWLPTGTTVRAQSYTMHRDPFVFPNPDDFDPSRWREPTKAMLDASMPYGRGSRVCIGKHLAYMELRLATARFFLAFPEVSVSAKEGMNDEDMVAKVFFLLFPQGKRCLLEL
ncbi:unnamed protein product [Clonostachys rhizophaga]|uniref:Cytochrome P450 n=1 Tax=Clonostachys rhizophaga TaxID=160324 RepID=A0A9N9VK69_9HYPO|nr:unnamed protein product [Clonostachys rhizophaga]